MQPTPQQPFWHYTVQEAFSLMKSDENGITEQEAADRKKAFGPNSLKEKINTTGLLLFLRQFKTPVTLLLIGAAILSMIVGDTVDSYIIFTIIIVSSLLGFWQEKGAADAVSQLYKMIQVKCTVLRDKQTKEIPVEDVVPGDIILLSAGALIPADCLLISSKELFVDEAAFTGETYPMEKD